ncbi:MAG: AEC family transporter [Lachnospiraceae bacterium]|nr:AEC family transporter [Lachnospiraceae bacterium]
MEVFQLTLSQMLTMFIYIIVGYVLRKSKILPENAYLTMSRLETYFFVPALNLHNWMTNCTTSALKENSVLIVYGAVLIACAVGLAYLLCRLFVRKTDNPEEEYQRNIYKYAMTFGNYGFMGNFIVLGIWGSEMLFRYSMFTLVVTFVCSSWGLMILIPKGKSGKLSMKDLMKRVFTPPIIALFIGLVAGLFEIKQYVPEFLVSVMSGGADCMGPVAMVLAGVVIGGYDIKELLGYKKVYVASLMRLILIPAVFVSVLHLFGVNKEIITLALIAFATPLGLNTIVYPAAYGGDVKTGAAMTMISSVLSVITIPLMYLLFVALL